MIIIKVLVLTTTFPRYKGDPTPAFVYKLSKRLCSKGFKIFVVAPHHVDSEKFEVMDNMNVYRFSYFYPYVYQKLAYEGGILFRLKKSILAKIQVPLFCFSEFYYSTKIIKKEKINLIHSHWLIPSGFIGAICKKLFDIPHIVTIHGSDINTINNSKLLQLICRFIFKNSDVVNTNSSFTKRKVEMIFGEMNEKIKVIPMGVDVDFFKSAGDDLKMPIYSSPLILTVGRLIDWKGTKYLIFAMEKVLENIPNAKLVIVGDGPEKGKLIDLVNSLNLQENVLFIGYVKDNDLPTWYKSADIFVLPSVNLNGQTEGLGVVLLESMACGTPVIGSDVGGIGDIIIDGHNGFLVPEKSPNELSSKIIELLSNSETTKKFSYNGFNTVMNRFSWDKVADEFSSIYFSL